MPCAGGRTIGICQKQLGDDVDADTGHDYGYLHPKDETGPDPELQKNEHFRAQLRIMQARHFHLDREPEGPSVWERLINPFRDLGDNYKLLFMTFRGRVMGRKPEPSPVAARGEGKNTGFVYLDILKNEPIAYVKRTTPQIGRSRDADRAHRARKR